MAASGLSLTVSGDGDRAALHEAIWEHLREVIDMYASGDAYRTVVAYLVDAIPAAEDRGRWGANGDRLDFLFPDVGGHLRRSSDLWKHFTTLAAATEWERVCSLAEELELEITSERPTFAVESERGPHFVVARGELWAARPSGLVADGDKAIAVGDLDESEREQHRVALERCMCGMCNLIRPNDAPLKSILAWLDDADTAGSAAWYLSRVDAKRPDLLLAMIRAGARDAEGLATPVERYARHLGADVVWELVPPLVAKLDRGGKALALRALDVTMPPAANRDLLVREVLAGLAGNDELAVVAAEIAGHVGRAGDAVDAELAEAVAKILDRKAASKRLRHSAVLGLVNLHLPRRAPSPEIKARLQREAKLKTEAGELATWMLNW